VAIEVPEMVLVAVSLVLQPAVMEEPGAKCVIAHPGPVRRVPLGPRPRVAHDSTG